LQVEIPEPYRTLILDYGKTINEDSVVELEDNPHITLLYGIHTNNINEIKSVLGDFPPFEIQFGATKLFMADDLNPNDVLFIEIFCKQLRPLKEKLVLNTNVTQTYTGFLPHCTVGFLQPGHALQFIGTNPLVGEWVTINNVTFGTEDNREIIYGREIGRPA